MSIKFLKLKLLKKRLLSFVFLFIGLPLALAHAAPSFTIQPLTFNSSSPLFYHDVKMAPSAQYVRYRPRRVREILRERGYRKIKFIDRELPVYIVEACKNGRKFRIRLNRWARIRDRESLGSCRSRFNEGSSGLNLEYDDRGGRWDNQGDSQDRNRLSPRDIRQRLKSRGFNRIEFRDRNLPYKVIACKHNRKMKLRINGRGRITDRNRIGRCNTREDRRERPSLREIKDLLRQRGYHKIRYEDRQLPRYKLLACRRGAEFNIVVNRWGDILRRKRSGWCRSFRDDSEPVTPALTFDDSELSGTTRIDADTCQNQLEYLVDRKKIYFTIDSADIGRDSYSLLRKIAHVMNRCPSVRIEVAGHTDSVGSRYYNKDLSNRRAYSVARELSDLGVSHSRLIPRGYGEDHPIVSNETNRGKAQNRRIDFIVAWKEDDYADR